LKHNEDERHARAQEKEVILLKILKELIENVKPPLHGRFDV
jgi:hypothetical protein